MDIQELTRKVTESSKSRTQDERIDLLRSANIIDDNGYYSSNFFTAETVRKDKQSINLNVQ